MNEGPDFGVVASHADDDLADLVDVFRHPIRRYVVSYLLDRETAGLDELADVVTGWTTARDDGVASSTERDRLRIQLYHVHLPSLAAVDVLEFDSEERTVRLDESTERLRALLRWLDGDEFSAIGNGLQ